MRRFASARQHPSETLSPARTSSQNVVDATKEPLSGVSMPTEPSITDEDGDLWQPTPENARSEVRNDVILPVFMELTATADEHADRRWTAFLTAIGFEAEHDHKPCGFEDLDWTPIFPPDREMVAQWLEPVVAKGDDIQSAICDFGRKQL